MPRRAMVPSSGASDWPECARRPIVGSMSLEGLVRAALYVCRLLAVAAVVGGLLFIGGMTQMGLNDYLRPPRAMSAVTPGDLGLTYRDALLLTDDGLILASWFVPGTRSDTLILVHGLGSEQSELLPLAR